MSGSIAHQGDPAPGGGIFRDAFGPIVNNRGQVAFIGDLTPAPAAGQTLGVPGTVMPGIGTIAQASAAFAAAPPVLASGAGNNNHGQVFFNATLTDGSVVLLLATPR